VKKILIFLILSIFFSNNLMVFAGPSKRIGATMFYDPINECMLLFGGAQSGATDYNRFNDLWKYDYSTDTWTEINISVKPSGRFNTPAAYDGENNQLIIYGGESTDSEPQMWAFSLEDYSWRRLYPTNMPSPGRCNTPLVYDEKSKKIIMFGGMGYDGSFPSDTWVYDAAGNSWTRMAPNGSPHGRYGHALFYDPVNEAVLMFGGHWFEGSNEGFCPDLWKYDYGSNSWTLLEENLPLSAQFWHSYSASSLDGVCTIFGGTNGHELFDETWIYSEGEFTQIAPASHPSTRILAAMAYDSVNNVTLLFGGLDYAAGDSADLWALKENGAWVKLAGAGTQTEETHPVPPETNTTSSGIPGFPMTSVLLGLLIIPIILRYRKHAHI
jgi:hypothetical protein